MISVMDDRCSFFNQLLGHFKMILFCCLIKGLEDVTNLNKSFVLEDVTNVLK